MLQRLSFLAFSTLLATSVCIAHEPGKKVLDAFSRNEIRQFKVAVHKSGEHAIFSIHGHGHYPNKTALSVGVRYIDGESSELYPYGKPGRKKYYLFKRVVFVNDDHWSLKIKVKGASLPPGEYVVAIFFVLREQTRAVRKQYINEYVPEDERPDDICTDCRRHFHLDKTVLVNPSMKLRPEFRSMPGKKLWQKQKAQAMAGILDRYGDWLGQVEQARTALEKLRDAYLDIGLTQQAEVGKEMDRHTEQSEREEVEAVETLRLARAGMKEFASKLRGGVPRDAYRYYRLRAYGDGLLSGEDVNDPNPRRQGYQPWRFNYIKPRLDLVLKEMGEHRKRAKIVLHRFAFYQVKSMAEEVLNMLKTITLQLEGAKDLVAEGGLLSRYEEDQEKAGPALVRSFAQRYSQPMLATIKARVRYAHFLKETLRVIKSTIHFPVGTWPIPPEISKPPVLSDEEKQRTEKKLFGDLEDEMRK